MTKKVKPKQKPPQNVTKVASDEYRANYDHIDWSKKSG